MPNESWLVEGETIGTDIDQPAGFDQTKRREKKRQALDLLGWSRTGEDDLMPWEESWAILNRRRLSTDTPVLCSAHPLAAPRGQQRLHRCALVQETRARAPFRMQLAESPDCRVQSALFFWCYGVYLMNLKLYIGSLTYMTILQRSKEGSFLFCSGVCSSRSVNAVSAS